MRRKKSLVTETEQIDLRIVFDLIGHNSHKVVEEEKQPDILLKEKPRRRKSAWQDL